LFIKSVIPTKGSTRKIPTIINARTDATITNSANISCEKGFMSRKAVFTIRLIIFIGGKDTQNSIPHLPSLAIGIGKSHLLLSKILQHL
jgi:hypothetical protein